MIFGDCKEPAYDHLDAKKSMGERNGAQPGDPVKVCTMKYHPARQSC
jgi:hypothetical protein